MNQVLVVWCRVMSALLVIVSKLVLKKWMELGYVLQLEI